MLSMQDNMELFMVRPLHEPYWDSFCKPIPGQLRFDGLKFEGLIRDLLSLHFPGDWQSTSISWDGGKDFVNRSIHGEKQWAECKMYHKPIGVLVLSTTLIMAILNEVGETLIFSYSEVNRNARRHLGTLSSCDHLKLKIFDGARLDSIILNYWSNLRHHFSIDKKPVIPPRPGIVAVFVNLTRDIEQSSVQSDSTIPSGSSLYVDLKAPLILDILIENLDMGSERDCVIDLSELVAPGAPLLLSGDRPESSLLQLTLEPGEIKGVRRLAYANRPGKHELAGLKLLASTFDNLGCPQPVSVTYSTEYIEAHFLNEPQLVGAKMLSLIRAIPSRIQLTNHGYVGVVEGHSGVGKSRFGRELAYRLLDSGCKVATFSPLDFSGLDLKLSLKRILATVSDSPDPSLLVREDLGRPTSEGPVASLFDFLYAETNDSDEPLISSAIEIILTLLSSRSMAIIVDDFQGLSGQLAQFFGDLQLACQHSISSSALILLINVDALDLNSAAKSTRNEIARYSRESMRENCSIDTLPEFSIDIARQFLNQTLSIVSENGNPDVSLEFSSLVEKVLTAGAIELRPLALWQLVHYWIDLEIVKIEREGLFVYEQDFERLQNSVHRPWNDIDFIFRRRLEILERQPEQLFALKLLDLTGPLGLKDLADFNITKSSIRKLHDKALVRTSSSGKISIYHLMVEGFIHKNLGFEKPAAAALAASWSDRVRGEWIFHRPVAAFNIDCAVHPERASVEHVVACLSSSDGIEFQRQRAARHILNSFTPKDVAKHSAALINLAVHAGGMDGRTAHNEFLLKIERWLRRLPDEVISRDECAHLLFSAASQPLSSGIREKGLQVMTYWQERLSALSRDRGMELAGLLRIRAIILNRLCVYNKDVGNRVAAETCAKSSLLDAEAVGDDLLICLNYVDLGYIHYGWPGEEATVISNWKNGISHFESISHSSAATDAELFIGLVRSIVTYLEGEEQGALNMLSNVASMAQARSSTYYELQARCYVHKLELVKILGTDRDVSDQDHEMIARMIAIDVADVVAEGIYGLLVPLRYAQALIAIYGPEQQLARAHRIFDQLTKELPHSRASLPLRRSIFYELVRVQSLVGPDLKLAPECIRQAHEILPHKLFSRAKQGAPPPQLSTFYSNGINFPF